MLTVGDTFPAFALKAVKGGPEGLKLDTAFTDIASDTDAGKWKLVFFWPKDFTFVCPTEIVAFGKLAERFRRPRRRGVRRLDRQRVRAPELASAPRRPA